MEQAVNETQRKAASFSGENSPKVCEHDQKLQGTGVFYQSVGLIQCTDCKGWQLIRKPIK